MSDTRMRLHKFIVGRLEINSHVESPFSQHVVLKSTMPCQVEQPPVMAVASVTFIRRSNPGRTLDFLLSSWNERELIQQSKISLSLVWKQETSEGNGTRRGSEDQRRPVQILERGEIFLFYRPKVDREEAHSVDDVQRLYIVLRPESGERPIEEKQASDSGKEGAKGASKAVTGKAKASKKGPKEGGRRSSGKTSEKGSEGGHGSEEVNIEKQPLLRFLIIGKKRLPDPSKRGLPHWGFVDMVTTKIDDIKTALQGEEYDTATRGNRRKPPARALGEGVYRILRHYKGKKMHTHLIYKLELPPEDKKDEPQESLNIEREGSFIIQIKNPEQETSKRFPGLQKSKRRDVFPAHLQGVFGQRWYAPADPPDLLNYEGCEFLLKSASDDIDEELGLDIKTEGESNRSCSDLIDTFGEVAPTKPLLEGTWA